MRYKSLSESDRDYVRHIYTEHKDDHGLAQDIIAEHFNVTTRTVRNWANRMGLMEREGFDVGKILIYDLETSLVRADLWWTGKQFVGHHQLLDDPRIISVSWMWLGEEEVHELRWEDIPAVGRNPEYELGGYGCDKKLVEAFAPIYNKSQLAIGFNSDNFDKRFLAQRCIVHRVSFNRYVRSLDLMKGQKKEFRSPSYSMKYSAETYGTSNKQSHEGRDMWRKIQYHRDPEVRKAAMDSMVEYNKGDIVSTRDLYITMIPYLEHKTNFSTLRKGEKYACPNCGGLNVTKLQTTSTAAGTLQHILKCESDGQIYRVSDSTYRKYLESI